MSSERIIWLRHYSTGGARDKLMFLGVDNCTLGGKW